MNERSSPHYWQTLQDLDSSSESHEIARDEFAAVPNAASRTLSRRSFLQISGLTIGAATLAGCSAPVQKAIPYLNKPPELTPGVANWYASTCSACSANCGLLVKVRDGRPIKLEGNAEHPMNRGGLCAAGQASIFELYSIDRLQGPLIQGRSATWEELDQQVSARLAAIRSQGGKVRLLSGSSSSPTTRAVVKQFLDQFADGRHIVSDPVSYRAIAEAHLRSHHVEGIPSYHFSKAAVVVAFDADFLGTWISPVEFARDYVSLRKLDGGQHRMSRHYHLEPHVSLSGSNADHRYRLTPQEHGAAVLFLLTLLVQRSQTARAHTSITPELFSTKSSNVLSEEIRTALQSIADDLWTNRSSSLVITGSNNVSTQLAVNAINEVLGNYGSTIDLTAPSKQYQGNDADAVQLIQEMNDGQISALFIIDANPAYNHPFASQFEAGLKKVPLTVALNSFPDETTSLTQFVVPPHHFLEAWGDAEPREGVFSLSQPTIHPVFSTRASQESLLKWIGIDANFYDLLQQYWKSEIFPQCSSSESFQDFWDNSLRNGVRVLPEKKKAVALYRSDGLKEALDALSQPIPGRENDFQISFYETIALRDGRFANNPWLQELPNPITKITWDNYVSVSPGTAAQLQIKDGDIVRVSQSDHAIELPVQIQPGQHNRVFSVALGYGRRQAGKVGSGVGANAFPFLRWNGNTFEKDGAGVNLQKTGRFMAFAETQTHSSMEGRPIVRETVLAEFLKSHPTETEKQEPTIWGDHAYTGHKWGMAIDLNACTGCSACLAGCQIENNVPVVGKAEVRRRREMHWIRIDRYYNGDPETPEVVFQPMMCGQCDNAACESVCPVLATVHSSEGLNMQVYNRCVGTRYCANNCPFKVRRFNWFNYSHDDALANLVLNPDVTVRSRGVMEKCTFCVQRIEAGKIQARNENRALADGEIQTACQQSCPTQAIVFGDLNDPSSKIAKLQKDRRAYHLLDEINLRSNIAYLEKIRNPHSGETS